MGNPWDHSEGDGAGAWPHMSVVDEPHGLEAVDCLKCKALFSRTRVMAYVGLI